MIRYSTLKIVSTGHLVKRSFSPELEDSDAFGFSLYCVKLSEFSSLTSRFIKYLEPDEVIRANKYHFEKDRNRFIICRVVLKFLLSKKVGSSIAEIQIRNDTNKKPFLLSHPSFFFNLSHSGDIALITIGKNILGVDIEKMDVNFDYQQILPQVFDTREIEEVLKSHNATRTFYTFWTRKEAIVKATGKGIQDSLPQIPIRDGHHSVDSQLMGGILDLQVMSFPIHIDYIATIAFSGAEQNSTEIPLYIIPASIERIL